MFIGGHSGVVSRTLELRVADIAAVDAKIGIMAPQATKHGTVSMLLSGTI